MQLSIMQAKDGNMVMAITCMSMLEYSPKLKISHCPQYDFIIIKNRTILKDKELKHTNKA